MRRVLRKVPDFPGQTPLTFTVYATEFFYNKGAEVQVVSLRQWDEVNGQVAEYPAPVTLAIREFRGSGARRYMMRERHPITLDPLFETASWTFYAAAADPLFDIAYDWNGTEYDAESLDRYDLGWVRIRWDDALGDDVFRYFHSDQTGSTRALSDSPAPPVSDRMVYTAFGEIVNDVASVDTRYRYVGAFGAETFGDLVANFKFPFVRVGDRWYDPEAGRILQRGVLGSWTGRSPYVYSGNNPVAVIVAVPYFWKEIISGIGGGALTGAILGGIPGAIIGGIAGGISALSGEIVSGGAMTAGDAFIGGLISGIPGGAIAGAASGSGFIGVVVGGALAPGQVGSVGVVSGVVAGSINGGRRGGARGAVVGAGLGGVSGLLGGYTCGTLGPEHSVIFGFFWGSMDALIQAIFAPVPW